MRFAITVTGPAYGTQQASSALQFARAVLQEGHELLSIFFYREGVYNANQLTAPASDEFDLVRAWQALHDEPRRLLTYLCSCSFTPWHNRCTGGAAAEFACA